MNDDVAWQVAEHAQAVAIWILRYITKNNLPVADEETWPNFKFHMARLRALLEGELEMPLHLNPLSDAILQGKRSDEDYTEPVFCSLWWDA